MNRIRSFAASSTKNEHGASDYCFLPRSGPSAAGAGSRLNSDLLGNERNISTNRALETVPGPTSDAFNTQQMRYELEQHIWENIMLIEATEVRRRHLIRMLAASSSNAIMKY